MKNPIKWIIENFGYKSLYEQMHIECKKAQGHADEFNKMLEESMAQTARMTERVERLLEQIEELTAGKS